MAGLVTVQDCYVPKTREEEEEIERCYKRYGEIASTLPKEKGWKTEFMFQIGGFWLPPKFGFEGYMWIREHFKAKPTDIFLTTMPKSGTTWLKALVFSIINRSRFDFSTHPLLTNGVHACVPFMELTLFRTPPIGDPEILPSPRVLATHLPFSLLPDTILNSGSKLVYICREPKDMFVSYWHFNGRIGEKGCAPISLEEGFDLFCKGVSPFGPYWDHLLGYWKASLELPNRVLFLRYEDMKENTLFHVKTLAEFLGFPFSTEEEENGVIQEIIKLCSFESMSNFQVNKAGVYREHLKNDIFFRKGDVGDWKNYLTDEMSQRLNRIIEQKLHGSGFTFQV